MSKNKLQNARLATRINAKAKAEQRRQELIQSLERLSYAASKASKRMAEVSRIMQSVQWPKINLVMESK